MIVRRYICHDFRDILYGPWYSWGRDTACSLTFSMCSLLSQRMPNNGPAFCKSLGRTRVETVLRKGPIQCRRYFITVTSMSWRCCVWTHLNIDVYPSANGSYQLMWPQNNVFQSMYMTKLMAYIGFFITSYYSYKTWLLDSVILSLKLTRVLHNQRFFLPSIFQFFRFHVFTMVSRESFSGETIVEHTYPSDGSINRWN